MSKVQQKVIRYKIKVLDTAFNGSIKELLLI